MATSQSQIHQKIGELLPKLEQTAERYMMGDPIVQELLARRRRITDAVRAEIVELGPKVMDVTEQDLIELVAQKWDIEAKK